MSETLIQLSILVLACVYIGLLLGKRSGNKEVSKRVEEERAKLKEQVEKEHTELASELHGELSKVRESIIQSAHAYQNVVSTLGEKLAPWDEVQKSLSVDKQGELPLLIVEGSVESKTESDKSKSNNVSDTSVQNQDNAPKHNEEDSEVGSEVEVEGPSLGEKAAQLIKEDRAASQIQKQPVAKAVEPEAASSADSLKVADEEDTQGSSKESETKPVDKIPQGAARFAH